MKALITRIYYAVKGYDTSIDYSLIAQGYKVSGYFICEGVYYPLYANPVASRISIIIRNAK